MKNKPYVIVLAPEEFLSLVNELDCHLEDYKNELKGKRLKLAQRVMEKLLTADIEHEAVVDNKKQV